MKLGIMLCSQNVGKSKVLKIVEITLYYTEHQDSDNVAIVNTVVSEFN